MSKPKRRVETMAELREEIRTEAAREAIDALREVCRDKAATSQAKASAAANLLRAAGFFAEEQDDPDDKLLSELTPAELANRAEKARLRVEALEREAAERDEESVFD